MISEFYYFDELADPRQTPETSAFSSNSGPEIHWAPQEIARLRRETTNDSWEKMPHEKAKS
jgi:hypothetical protein